MIPIIILAIEDESSREFMIRLYESSISWMYYEARKHFTAPEDVEDVVSEAVVKLVDKLDLLQTLCESKRLAYAVTTVRHVSFHVLHHRNIYRMESFDDLEEYLPSPNVVSPEKRVLEEQRNRRLQEILGALPVEDRLLLEEKYILMWPDTEIAKIFGIKPESVRMRITRAKRSIAKALTEQGFFLDEWI